MKNYLFFSGLAFIFEMFQFLSRRLYILRQYTFCEYTFREYTLREYTLRKFMLREYTFCRCTTHNIYFIPDVSKLVYLRVLSKTRFMDEVFTEAKVPIYLG
jgi:hypothetical protein